MGKIIWLIIMIPISSFFTGLGVYSFRRKKPMWFWSGRTVRVEEIKDIPAYNRANGMMWLVYSAVFWLSVIAVFLQIEAAAIIAMIGWFAGIPALIITYRKIYAKYSRRQ